MPNIRFTQHQLEAWANNPQGKPRFTQHYLEAWTRTLETTFRITQHRVEAWTKDLQPPKKPTVFVSGTLGETSPFDPFFVDDEHLSTHYRVATDAAMSNLIVDEIVPASVLFFEFEGKVPEETDLWFDAAHEGTIGFSLFADPLKFSIISGLPKAHKPVLTNIEEGPFFFAVGITAMSHDEGVTTFEEYSEENDLPHPAHARFRVYLASNPEVVVQTVIGEAVVEELQQIIESLSSNTDYLIDAAWLDGKYLTYSVVSDKLAVSTVGGPGDPVTETLGGTFTVECDGKTLRIEVLDPEEEMQGIWWQFGRSDNGGASFQSFDGSAIAAPLKIGSLVKHFTLLDEGILFSARWWRKIGGLWLVGPSSTPPFVTCETPEAIPVPFFITPPGVVVDENFVLSWEYRGDIDFWSEQILNARIRISPADSVSWTTLEESNPGTSYEVDISELDPGWYLLEIMIKSATNEANPTQFPFRVGDPDPEKVTTLDWKDPDAFPTFPEDAEKIWTGEGFGSDNQNWDLVPGVGLRVRGTPGQGIDFGTGILALQNLGEPVIAEGVLTFSERGERNSGLDRFTNMIFAIFGFGFSLSDSGPARKDWGGILLRRRTSWGVFEFSGNPRAFGGSGKAAGVVALKNLPENRNYIYGQFARLLSIMHVRRVREDNQVFQQIHTQLAIENGGFTTNRVQGLHSYMIRFRFKWQPGRFLVSMQLLGPNVETTGWMFEDLVVHRITFAGTGTTIQQRIPCGFCGLAYANPTWGGQGLFHSLVIESSETIDDLEMQPTVSVELLDEDTVLIASSTFPFPELHDSTTWRVYKNNVLFFEETVEDGNLNEIEVGLTGPGTYKVEVEYAFDDCLMTSAGTLVFIISEEGGAGGGILLQNTTWVFDFEKHRLAGVPIWHKHMRAFNRPYIIRGKELIFVGDSHQVHEQDRDLTTEGAFRVSPMLNNPEHGSSTMSRVILRYEASADTQLEIHASGDGGRTWPNSFRFFIPLTRSLGRLQRAIQSMNVTGTDLRFRIRYPEELIYIRRWTVEILPRGTIGGLD